MKKLLLIGAAALLSGCFDGSENPADKGGSDNDANPSPKLAFASSADQVEQGDSVQLVWQGEDVENCQAEGAWSGGKPVSGSEFIQLSELGNQQFGLTCDAVDGVDTLTKTLTVLVVEADSGVTPSLTFTSSANQVEQGQTTQLIWSGEAIENCQASGAWTGSKASEGIETVQLTTLGNQQFSLSCDVVESSETISRTVTVMVLEATGGETAELTVSSAPSEIEQGQSVLITWSSQAVENCQASGAWSGAKATAGTESVTLSSLGSQTFSLSCEAIQSSDTLTRDTSVNVVPIDSSDDPKSGVDGDDADALYEHFNQYAQ